MFLGNEIKLLMPFPKGNLIASSSFGLSFITASLSFPLFVEFEKAPFKALFTRYNPLK
jgi:hypothetical protein